jgi:hypothetical protein
MSKITQEEKIAIKLTDLLSDIRLDLDLLGMYLAKIATKGFFLRAERVFQASEDSLTMDTEKDHYERIKRLGNNV